MNENDSTHEDMLTALRAVQEELTALRTDRASAQGAGTRITVGELAEKALDCLNGGTLRTYQSYIKFLSQGDPNVVTSDGKPWHGIPTRWADEVLPSELESILELIRKRQRAGADRRATNREAAGRVIRNTRGDAAAYNAVGAWRAMFEIAIRDRHLAEGMNPAAKVKKPKRTDGRRMALEDKHFEQMVRLIGATGDDPQLDAMVLKFIDIAGARREGLLNLSVDSIDREECTVRLDEKGGVVVDQPVPDWFVEELLAFAASRGSVSRGQKVFMKRCPGGKTEPMGRRRFDTIFADHLQASFEWADRMQVTAHTLRHHAITRVERRYGHAVAAAFARHMPSGVTDLYALASQAEVAFAVVSMFGGHHPWLGRQPRPRR